MQFSRVHLSYLFLGLGALCLVVGVLDAILSTVRERWAIWYNPELGKGALASMDLRERGGTMGQLERGMGLGCFGLLLLYVGGFLWQALPPRWTLNSAFERVARYLLELCLPYSLIGGGVFLALLWVENLLLDMIETARFGGLWRSRAAGRRPGEQRAEMGCITLVAFILGGVLLWVLR